MNLSASVGDPGTNDTHTCSIDWGDGTIEPGTLAAGVCTGSHAYSVAGPETITVTVSDDDGGTGSDSVNITVEEGPSISINDVSVREGDGGATDATFKVTLSAASEQEVGVDYATADGTASAPGDYTAIPTTTLTFAPGETEKTVTVEVNEDTIDEVDETFFVDLSNPTNATIGDGQGRGQGTIVDDDGPTISIDDVSVREGDSDMTDADFTVSLAAASPQEVTVDYATADGTASAPGDYTAIPTRTLTLAAGETEKTVTVKVNGDTIDEADEESFFVNLSNPDNATIEDGRGVGTIEDDDETVAPALGDFKCYEAERLGTRFDPRQVVLADQFNTERVNVVRTEIFCNPVATNGGEINDPNAHLTCYQIRDVRNDEFPAFTSRRVEASDQFGTHTLLLRTIRTLCLPSSKSPAGEIPGPPPTSLDHFKCYTTKQLGTRFDSRQVLLTDQFNTERVNVVRPEAFCTPVGKNGEGIKHPTAHLTCYKIRDVRGDEFPRFRERRVEANDQFGTQTLRLEETRTLCLPSSKTVL